MKKYKIEYLAIFDRDLSEVWHYITYNLQNPAAANELIEKTEDAIKKRLINPDSYEKYLSNRKRELPYYRIYVGNYIVWYVVKGNTMEVRRFLYSKRSADEFIR
jgi:plasmid stabilization system protein ParE